MSIPASKIPDPDWPGSQTAAEGQGLEGPMGPAGPEGPAGGPEGPTGPAGPAGPAGADSIVPGPAGADGAAGTTGPAGAGGPAGADSTVQGPEGPQGPAGAAGATGPAGADGGGSALVAFKAQADLDAPTQSLPTNTWVFLTGAAINVEVFDTHDFYTLSTGRFQPTIAGYYLIVASAAIDGLGSGKVFQVMITKNGSVAAGSGRVWGIKVVSPAAGSTVMSTATGLVYMNGTTDYCQLAGNHNDVVNRSTPPFDGWLSFVGSLFKAD